jgi:hypothetical protein
MPTGFERPCDFNHLSEIEKKDKSALKFLIDDINVVVGDQDFQYSVEIPMGTNCAPLFANLT